MRVNTTRSMELARRVKGRFGTWQAVREAAKVEDGIYVLEPRSQRDGRDTDMQRRPTSA